MMSVDRVRPEMGLLEEPIVPTRFPETAAKKNPATAMTPAARIAGREGPGEHFVDEDHHDEHRHEAAEDELDVEVLFETGRDLGLAGGLLDVAHGPLDPGGEVLPHLVERVAGADEHAADGDGPDDELPDVGDHVRPGNRGHVRAGTVEPLDELGAEEVHEQGREEPPGEDAAGEVERREARADDVADAQVGGVDAGAGDGHGPADVELRRRGIGAEAHEARAHLPDLQDELLAGCEELDNAEGVKEGSEAHGLEEVLGARAPLLAGLVDLGRGPGFGEGEVGVGDHDPAEERDEQDAEKAADEHQERRFDVGVERVEVRPGADHYEGRDGEDGPGRHGFADRAHGPGDVFLEYGALHQAEHGHSDDRGGVGRRDGHAGPEAEVGVRRPEDDGHDDAEDDRAEGEFPHLGLLGDVGLMAHRALLPGGFSRR